MFNCLSVFSHQALAVTDSLEEAAELLAKSKTNVRMVVSKLELDLGRQLEIPRPRAGDDGKLLLVRLRKRAPSELTAAGKWYYIAAPASIKPLKNSQSLY